MDTLSRTWRLYKQSFAVLSADAEILWFPVLSAVSAILLAAGVFIPLHRDGTLAAMRSGSAGWDGYLAVFTWYYLNYFIVIFFNSALVGCASIRLSGGDPTAGDGLRIAVRRLRRIAVWAFVTATVGMVLSSLTNRRRGLLFRAVGTALSVGWTLITYLIVPVLILEDRPVFDSVRRSSELFRKHWGEQVSGSFGFGILNLLLMLPAVLAGALIWRYDRVGAVIVVVVYLLFLSAVSSAVKGIFTVALYRYATEGVAPLGFSAESIDPGWKHGYRRLDHSAGIG